MSRIINGKEIASKFREKLKEEIIQLKNKFGGVPGLAVVQVGNNPASSVYVKAKQKMLKRWELKLLIIIWKSQYLKKNY